MVPNIISKGDQVVSLKWWFKLSKMVKGTPYGPDIDLVVVWLLLDDLGRQVQRGSDPSVLLHVS